MDAPLDKDAAIIDVFNRLRERLGPDAFVLTDHWESDLCAVGIANPANLGILAYISCYGEQGGSATNWKFHRSREWTPSTKSRPRDSTFPSTN